MKYKVVIDPGHGGNDPGASGNGIIEKNMNLDISKYMYDRFNQLGIPVRITRDSDIELSPTARTQKALQQFGSGTDVILISNHINAGGGEGAEVIYALRNSSTLASSILNELEKAGQPIRKYYQLRLPTDSSKDYYFIIRDTPNTQALIVEYGFLDNTNDAQRLKNNYKNYAEAVVRAVTTYAGYNYVPVSGSGYYVVKKGDTLWSIARNYGLTVDELKALNNLTSNNLNIGDTLLVSKATIAPGTEGNQYYTVLKGDTLYSIAQKYNMSLDELKALNNKTNNLINVGDVLLIKTFTEPSNGEYATYIVEKGDTLYSIANKYNLTVAELKSLNNLTSDTLSIGQNLKVSPIKSSDKYIVKSGDTLYSIANSFNTSVDSIKSLNNLTSDLLSIGQELMIPTLSIDTTIETNYHIVGKGDTLYSLAKQYNTTVNELKTLNNLTDNILSIGQKLAIPS